MLAGWQVARKELAVIRSGRQLWGYCLRHMVATEGNPSIAFTEVRRTAETANWDDGIPTNPYSGKACSEYQWGSEQYLGDFSYLLLRDHWGNLVDCAIVVYAPQPTVAQRRYYQLFMHPASTFDPDLSRGGPDVVRIGGDCGNNYVYLARGLTPAGAIAELNRQYTARDTQSADDVYSELEFLTSEQYAKLQDALPEATMESQSGL